MTVADNDLFSSLDFKILLHELTHAHSTVLLNPFKIKPKTLNNKTFQLFIELLMKSEDSGAVTSPSISKLAA